MKMAAAVYLAMGGAAQNMSAADMVAVDYLSEWLVERSLKKCVEH